MIDSTRQREEPLTLELGVGEIVGNPLVSALEQAVRSHGVGDIVELQLKGGDYNSDLVFKVPTDHPEIERLQGRYRSYAPSCCLPGLHVVAQLRLVDQLYLKYPVLWGFVVLINALGLHGH